MNDHKDSRTKKKKTGLSSNNTEILHSSALKAQVPQQHCRSKTLFNILSSFNILSLYFLKA